MVNCPKGSKRKGKGCTKVKSNIFRTKSNLTRFFLWATIVMVSISALISSSFLLFGEFNETTFKILLTTLILGGVSLLGLISGSARNNLLKIFGFVSSISAGFSYLLLIWEFTESEMIMRTAISLTIIAVAISHVVLLGKLRLSRDNLIKYGFWVLTGLITVVSLMLLYLVIREDVVRDLPEWYFRVLGFLAILDVSGSILLPVLKRVRS